jgi:hypothetical protein
MALTCPATLAGASIAWERRALFPAAVDARRKRPPNCVADGLEVRYGVSWKGKELYLAEVQL